MEYYGSEILYIQSAETLQGRLTKINQVITALYDNMLENAGAENISEYQLDDGQIKIRTAYRSIEQVEKTIDALERQKQRILNQLNGRSFVLRDQTGLRP